MAGRFGKGRLALLLIFVTLLVLVLASPALALVARGPVDTTSPGLGYPLWYQDVDGTALELNIGPVNSFFDPIDPNNPDSVAAGFGEEAFYWDANATITLDTGGLALLVMALEAAWERGPPIAGDEVVFQRLRIRIDCPVDGTYTVVHPYGTETFQVTGAANNRDINFTADVGLVAGEFNRALLGYIDPFLRSTSAPAGFLGDAATATTVTGSPNGTNYFEVQGPAGSNLGGPGDDTVRTELFTVQGKIYAGTPFNVDQATFSRDAASGRVSVWASAYGTGHTMDASWPGQAPVTLTDSGDGRFFASIAVADAVAVPASVTVTANRGTPLESALDKPVDDVVTIIQADYLVDAGTLVVSAKSSDGTSPALSVPGYGALTGGKLTVTGVAVPPAVVEVVSEGGGKALQVVNVITSQSTVPVAADDVSSVGDGGSVQIAVLANDSAAAPLTLDPATVAITADPASGTAVADSITGLVTYTPNAGFTGTDTFSYTVNDSAGTTSNTAVVTVEVKPLQSVSGTVTDEGTGLGVSFILMKISRNGVLIDAAITDSNGDYSFQVPDGTYVVTPSQFGRTFTPATGNAVVFSDGGPITNVDFVRNLPPLLGDPRVVSPSTGDPLPVGTPVLIEWSVAAPPDDGLYHVYAYAADGTYYWLNTQAGQPGKGSFTYNWTVGQPIGTGYVIRVWYVDAAGNWLYFDDSDAAFDITSGAVPQPSVTAPNTGVAVATGEVVPIQWTLANPAAGLLHVYAYAADGTYYWLTTQIASAAVTDYSFDWTVAQPAATGYVNRVWFVDVVGNWLSFGDSSPSFEITAGP